MPTSTTTPPPPTTPQTRSSSARPRWALPLIAVVVIGALVAVAWSLLTPSPDAVTIDDAIAAVDDAAATATGTPDGTWTVDTGVEAFSLEATSGTFVGFRIDEELSSIGATQAIGRTPQVSGTVTLDGTSLTAAEFTADLTAIVSDQSRREGAIQRALGTGDSPTATFTLTAPVDLSALPTAGQSFTVSATGDLTVNGTTQSVTVPLDAVWTGEVVVVTGSLDVALSDHGITAPSAPVVVSVADVATVEFQLYLTR